MRWPRPLPSPVTVLPLAVPADRTTNLRVIADADQQVDHSHQPVPPVSPGGFPYRYKVRLQGANAYAFTADEVLALFIDGYQSQPGRDREAQLEQVKLRGRHCTGVIVNHVAQAMFAGQLSPEEEAVLQRSAEYDTGRDPITVDECPRWDHPDVPMLLMGDLVRPRVRTVRAAARQRQADLARPRRAIPGRPRRARPDRPVGEPRRHRQPARRGPRSRRVSLGRDDQGLSNDHIAMMVLGCIAIGVLYAKRQSVLAGAGGWLRDHQLLTDHNAIITIPHLGGLDLARILILIGILVVLGVTARIAVRRRATPANR